MEIGLLFPTTEIGNDPAAIREFAVAAEEMGYKHLLTYEHPLGANPANRPGWTRYTHESAFHEPFVLFGFWAGVTKRIGFCTAILILPQRQTALVAKQASEVDILSGGRMRLGIGIGWNDVEYEALGMDFHNRGRRMEEQVEVMRQLWTHQSITFKGKHHTITEAGINILPVQRPIPIWMGGNDERVLERIGRIGDGWIPNTTDPKIAKNQIETIRAAARAAGRDPMKIGIEPRFTAHNTTPEQWHAFMEGWRSLGATHLGVSTMGAGYTKLDQHLNLARKVMHELSAKV